MSQRCDALRRAPGWMIFTPDEWTITAPAGYTGGVGECGCGSMPPRHRDGAAVGLIFVPEEGRQPESPKPGLMTFPHLHTTTTPPQPRCRWKNTSAKFTLQKINHILTYCTYNICNNKLEQMMSHMS